MAKNQAAGSAHPNGARRDRSQVKRDEPAQTAAQKQSKGPRRKILFPTEPTTISHERIDRAIDLVISRRK